MKLCEKNHETFAVCFFKATVFVLAILLPFLDLSAQTCPIKISNNTIELKPALCENTLGLLQGSTPKGGDGNYRYQWEASDKNCGENSFKPIKDATEKDYILPANAEMNACYRRVVTSGDCKDESNKVRVDLSTIQEPVPPTTVVMQPTCVMPTGTITVTSPAPAPGITYSIDGTNFTNTTGVFAGLRPNIYSVQVRYSAGCVSPINYDTIQIAPIIGGEIKPASANLCSGSATLTVSGGTSYKWYRDGVLIIGATAATYKATEPGTYTADIVLGNCTAPASNNAVVVKLPPINFTVTSVDPNCTITAGSITVKDVSGGSGSGFEFSKDGGATYQREATFQGLQPGTYTVVVRDKEGCTSEAKLVTIKTFVSTLKAAVAVTNVTCNQTSGSAKVEASGGKSPYQYSLDGGTFQAENTFKELIAGQHKVVVKDAEGCQYETNFAIENINSTLAATAATKDATCDKAGAVEIKASGGTTPYSYRLNDGAFQQGATFANLPAGNYKATVKDQQGCSIEITFEVKQTGSDPNLVITNPSALCPGETQNLNDPAIVKGSDKELTYTYWRNADANAAIDNPEKVSAGTYYIKAVNKYGCFVVKPVVVTLHTVTPGEITASGSTKLCTDQSVMLTASAGKTYQWYRNETVIAGATENKYVTKLSGTYSIVINDGTCAAPAANTVTVTQFPPISFKTSAKDPSCTVTSGTITVQDLSGGSGQDYVFSKDGGTTYQKEATFQNLAPGTYKVVVKDSEGCRSEVKSVTINSAASTLKATVKTSNIRCGQTAGTATVEASGGKAPYQYSLDGGAFTTENSFKELIAGQHKMVVKDAEGCQYETNFAIENINSTLAATAKVSDASCDKPGAIEIKATGGDAPYSYRLGDGTFQPGANFNNLPAGNYKATVKDQQGCSIELLFEVKKTGTVPDLIITNPPALCPGITQNLKDPDIVKGSDKELTYTFWQDADASKAISNPEKVTAGTYYVKAVNKNGCFTIKPVVITLHTVTPGQITASGSAQLCADESVTLTASTGKSYQWYRNETLITGATENTYVAKLSGTYSVAINDGTCTVTAANTVTVSQLPPITFKTSAKDPNCIITSGSITVDDPSGGSGSGFMFSRDNGETFQKEATFQGLQPGTYKIVVRDKEGCKSEAKTVTIKTFVSTLKATVAVTNVSCNQTSGSAKVEASGGKSPYQYSLDGGTFQAENTFKDLKAGQHKVVVKDAEGCRYESSFAVENINSTLAATATATDATCDKKGVIEVRATGGTAPFSYRIAAGNYQASASFGNLAPGKYEVTVKDQQGCTVIVIIDVKQSGTVPNLVVTNPPALCPGDKQNLQDPAIVKGSDKELAYTFWRNADATTVLSNPGAVEAGTYYIKATNQKNCSAVKAVVVSNHAAKAGRITASGPTIICADQSVTLSATEGTSYQWFRNDTAIAGARERQHITSLAGIYSVAINDGTCTIRAENTIRVQYGGCLPVPKTGVYVPSAFTPNGNGENDVLRPLLYNIRTLNYFRVFNRWGQVVFQTNAIGSGWDGKINGVLQPTETYTWILECTDNNGKQIKESGRTLLLR